MTSWFALAKKVSELLTENDRFGPVRKGNKLGLLPLTTISQEPVARNDRGEVTQTQVVSLSISLSFREEKEQRSESHYETETLVSRMPKRPRTLDLDSEESRTDFEESSSGDDSNSQDASLSEKTKKRIKRQHVKKRALSDHAL